MESQKHNGTYYSAYVKCDCCGRKVDPEEAQLDRVSEMTVCNGCKPDYISDIETDGGRVDFVEIPEDEIQWDEDEEDTDIRYEI